MISLIYKQNIEIFLKEKSQFTTEICLFLTNTVIPHFGKSLGQYGSKQYFLL